MYLFFFTDDVEATLAVQLTEDQRATLWAEPRSGESKLPVVLDPVTRMEYVLLPIEQYQRLWQLLDWSSEMAYPALDEAFAPGWNAPGMSDYDRYEEFRS